MFKRISLICLLLISKALFATEVKVIPEVHQGKLITSDNPSPQNRFQETIINQTEIQESPLATIQSLLKQEQSIVRLTHPSGDSSQSALSIRGFGDNAQANSLILIDGFPLTNPSLLAPNINAIALIDIAKVTIIQGSEGSLWGDQAVGGVVMIETRHPEHWMRDLFLGIGNQNQKFFSGLLGNQFANGFFFKIFGFADSNDHDRAHNQQRDYNLRLEGGRDYSNGMSLINMQTYTTQINFPGGLTAAQFMDNPRQATNNKNYFKYNTTLLQLLNKQLLSAHWLLETRLAQQKIMGKGFVFLNSTINEWQNNVEPRFIGQINQYKITVGYYGLANYYQLKNRLNLNQARSQQHHVYLQTSFPIRKEIQATLGTRSAWQIMRTEKIQGQPISSTSHIWVGEMGLRLQPSAAWELFLRRDGNFRFVKANEATWTPANVSILKAQTGVSYEAGIGWSQALQKTQLRFYVLNLQNEIAFDTQQTPEEPFGSFNNFPRTQRLGFTLTEHYQFSPSIVLDGQLNYVNPKVTAGVFSGKQIPAVPLWNGNLGLAYQFTTNWLVKYYILYTGARFASDDLENTGSKLPPYWLNNVALQYMLTWCNISAEIENLFNQTYAAYALFDTSSHEKLFYPGAGRSYLLTLKINID